MPTSSPHRRRSSRLPFAEKPPTAAKMPAASSFSARRGTEPLGSWSVRAVCRRPKSPPASIRGGSLLVHGWSVELVAGGVALVGGSRRCYSLLPPSRVPLLHRHSLSLSQLIDLSLSRSYLSLFRISFFPFISLVAHSLFSENQMAEMALFSLGFMELLSQYNSASWHCSDGSDPLKFTGYYRACRNPYTLAFCCFVS